MFQTDSLDKIRQYHLMGLDQTSNLLRYFRGNTKKVALAKIDFNKKPVANEKFFISSIDNFNLLIQLFDKGGVYKFDADKYDLYEADEGDSNACLYATDLDTGEDIVLIDNYGKLHLDRVELINDYTYCSGEPKSKGVKRLKEQAGIEIDARSVTADELDELCLKHGVYWFRGYPMLRLNNSWGDSIRLHWIIACMEWGIENIARCIGDESERTKDLHHRNSYRKTKDNSIMNLQALDPDTHKRLHGYFWRQYY